MVGDTHRMLRNVGRLLNRPRLQTPDSDKGETRERNQSNCRFSAEHSENPELGVDTAFVNTRVKQGDLLLTLSGDVLGTH